jgi:hypothetical protein
VLIPEIVNETAFHTKRFAKDVIQDTSLLKTCKNLWQFVYDHIAYKKDEDGKEQVRSPARAWHDRHNKDENGKPMGVDCDCYTVFISSVLTNLKIKHVLRITKYEADHFQHIYPIVPIANGKYITIDCVVHSFNYEEPYTEKKDTIMDLEYLNGVSDPSNNKNNDAHDLLGIMNDKAAMSELGRLFKRKSSGGDSSSEGGGKKKGRFKQFLNKGFHAANRFNPAAAAIRAGVLAAMKLNFMKIGSELRYTYLSEEEAQKKGVRMDRFPKMKRVREKLEKIFYSSGGKPENLKKAILKGKGNRNKDVPLSGFGYVSSDQVDGLHEDMPLSELLGAEMMSSESMQEVNGMGELGEPATAATIAAASTVLTTIVALIKKVGSLMPKKKGDAGENANREHSSGEGGGGESSSSDDSGSRNESSNDTNQSVVTTSNKSTVAAQQNTTEKEDSEDAEGGTANQRSANKDSASKLKLFWDKHKKWMKPTGIAVTSIGIVAVAYKFFKPKTTDQTKKSVNGLPEATKPRKTKHKIKAKRKSKVKHKTESPPINKKTTVELL